MLRGHRRGPSGRSRQRPRLQPCSARPALWSAPWSATPRSTNSRRSTSKQRMCQLCRLRSTVKLLPSRWLCRPSRWPQAGRQRWRCWWTALAPAEPSRTRTEPGCGRRDRRCLGPWGSLRWRRRLGPQCCAWRLLRRSGLGRRSEELHPAFRLPGAWQSRTCLSFQWATQVELICGRRTRRRWAVTEASEEGLCLRGGQWLTCPACLRRGVLCVRWPQACRPSP